MIPFGSKHSYIPEDKKTNAKYGYLPSGNSRRGYTLHANGSLKSLSFIWNYVNIKTGKYAVISGMEKWGSIDKLQIQYAKEHQGEGEPPIQQYYSDFICEEDEGGEVAEDGFFSEHCIGIGIISEDKALYRTWKIDQKKSNKQRSYTVNIECELQRQSWIIRPGCYGTGCFHYKTNIYNYSGTQEAYYYDQEIEYTEKLKVGNIEIESLSYTEIHDKREQANLSMNCGSGTLTEVIVNDYNGCWVGGGSTCCTPITFISGSYSSQFINGSMQTYQYANPDYPSPCPVEYIWGGYDPAVDGYDTYSYIGKYNLNTFTYDSFDGDKNIIVIYRYEEIDQQWTTIEGPDPCDPPVNYVKTSKVHYKMAYRTKGGGFTLVELAISEKIENMSIYESGVPFE